MRNASGQQGAASKVNWAAVKKNKSEQEHKEQNFWWADTRIPHKK